MRRKPSSPAFKNEASAASETSSQQTAKTLSIVGLMMGLAPVTCAMVIHLVVVMTGA